MLRIEAPTSFPFKTVCTVFCIVYMYHGLIYIYIYRQLEPSIYLFIFEELSVKPLSYFILFYFIFVVEETMK